MKEKDTMGRILTATTESIPGFEIVQVLGVVRGNTVRTRHVGRDILASFKTIIGGEIEGYTDLMTQAREQALERMLAQAEARGADAVIALRFETSNIMETASEILVYGTAVRVRRRSA